MTVDSRRLLLRVMTEVETADAAGAEVRMVLAALTTAATTVTSEPSERYWKIPAYWELTFWIDPSIPVHDAFDRLVDVAEAGWTVSAPGMDVDRWAVWNAGGGTVLFTSRVRWASLEVVRVA